MPYSERWVWMVQQCNALDRAIDRKIRLLLAYEKRKSGVRSRKSEEGTEEKVEVKRMKDEAAGPDSQGAACPAPPREEDGAKAEPHNFKSEQTNPPSPLESTESGTKRGRFVGENGGRMTRGECQVRTGRKRTPSSLRRTGAKGDEPHTRENRLSGSAGGCERAPHITCSLAALGFRSPRRRWGWFLAWLRPRRWRWGSLAFLRNLCGRLLGRRRRRLAKFLVLAATLHRSRPQRRALELHVLTLLRVRAFRF
jgi:hypothetical protein